MIQKNLKVLYIGGNGNISWWCVNKSLQLGHEVYIITRSPFKKTRRTLDSKVKIINVNDINNTTEIKSKLLGMNFDAVCDFICYSLDNFKSRYEVLKKITKQYIFISSVVVYKRETEFLPFKENTPQWDTSSYEYAKGKIEIENYLKNIKDLNWTIVRPAHTYDTIIPVSVGHNCFTAPLRYLNGKPLLIAGDGTNLWSTLHSSDFADCFCHLINNEGAYNNDFHITGEKWLNWIEISELLMRSLNIKKYKIVHIPIKQILELEINKSSNLNTTYLGANFRGQRLWCDIYNNEKVKALVPNWKQKIDFKDGIILSINWILSDKNRIRFNEDLNCILEKLTNENFDNSY